MRIVLWHGYLLGGTGIERLHAPARARVVERRARRRRPLSGAAAGGVRPRRAPTVARPDVGGLLPIFVLDRYEGYEVRLLQDCSRGGARALGGVERGGRARAAAGRPRLLQPRAARRARRRGVRRAVRGQGARLGAGVLDARQRGARRRGERARLAGRGDVRRAPDTSAAVLEDVVGHVERVHEVPPGVDVEAWLPEDRATTRSPPCSRPHARIRRTPETRTSGSPTTATPSVWRGFSRVIGRPSSTSASCCTTRASTSCWTRSASVDARAVIVGFGDHRVELEAPCRRTRRAVHRSARAPASGAPAGARRRVRRPVDLPGGVRDGRGRGGGRRLPTGRRAPFGSRGDRRRSRGVVPRRHLRHLAAVPSGDPAGAGGDAPRVAHAARQPTGSAIRVGGTRHGRRAVELGGRVDGASSTPPLH